MLLWQYLTYFNVFDLSGDLSYKEFKTITLAKMKKVGAAVETNHSTLRAFQNVWVCEEKPNEAGDHKAECVFASKSKILLSFLPTWSEETVLPILWPVRVLTTRAAVGMHMCTSPLLILSVFEISSPSLHFHLFNCIWHTDCQSHPMDYRERDEGGDVK